ncbi:hypothetical protein R1flu_012871 [Riccia fluitans]|uniref:Uncharacterized protein n=1 Tax=Riccia fluitans TaxID=41844 RepID=A0ABD1ZBU4_9MARC
MCDPPSTWRTSPNPPLYISTCCDEGLFPVPRIPRGFRCSASQCDAHCTLSSFLTQFKYFNTGRRFVRAGPFKSLSQLKCLTADQVNSAVVSSTSSPPQVFDTWPWRQHDEQEISGLQLSMAGSLRDQHDHEKSFFRSVGFDQRELATCCIACVPNNYRRHGADDDTAFRVFLVGIQKSKLGREKPQPYKDLFPQACHKPNTVIAIHDFTNGGTAKSMEPPSPLVVKDSDNNTYFDGLVFDPEQDYAQVLAEARSHAEATQKKSVSAKPPVLQSSKAPRVPRSHSARHHNPFLEDLEAMFPSHNRDSKFHDRFKGSSKAWKKLMFWKRGKKDHFGLEFEFGNGVLSSCTTPLHHAFKSKMRATVTPTSTTGSGSYRSHQRSGKRSSSGPIYSDGIPYIPASRSGRPCSGPLSGASTPSREGLYESPYLPLKKPSSGHGNGIGSHFSHKSPSGPLYVT